MNKLTNPVESWWSTFWKGTFALLVITVAMVVWAGICGVCKITGIKL